MSNFNTEEVDYQQLLQIKVLVPRLESLLDMSKSVRYVKQSNRMPLDVHSLNLVHNYQIQGNVTFLVVFLSWPQFCIDDQEFTY